MLIEREASPGGGKRAQIVNPEATPWGGAIGGDGLGVHGIFRQDDRLHDLLAAAADLEPDRLSRSMGIDGQDQGVPVDDLRIVDADDLVVGQQLPLIGRRVGGDPLDPIGVILEVPWD